jgi:FSR family fosmidomycin resistance protein-like MFS transporter
MSAPPLAGRSDALVIGLVSVAHLLSHFYQVALGPLFPLLRAEFDVSYTALGFIISLFYGVSGCCQAFVGILVDRYGGDRLMLFGLVTMSSAVLMMGFAPAYWVLLPLAVLAAFGNSVFHPADLSILSAKVNPRRLGRAFGLHGFGGTCGYFLSPIIIYYGVASFAGWRAGLVAAGLLGLGVALVIFRYRAALEMPRAPAAGEEGATPDADWAFYRGLLTNLPLVAAFFYFALVAGALAGLQSFSVTALIEIYDAPIYLAAAGLTAYLGGSAAGILVGGELADRIPRPALIASSGLAIAALLMACIGWFDLTMPFVITLFCGVGFCSGATQPSRDLLVKGATPQGASGKVFGFVYSGLDFGGAVGPLIFGWMMDGGEYRWVFLATAAMYGFAVLTVLQMRRGGAAAG